MNNRQFKIFSVKSIVFAILLLLLLIPTTYVMANKKPILINRKVFIMDFYNVNQNKEYSYLSRTIADAFQEPLEKTKTFELLKRNLWRQLVTKGMFKNKDAYDEDKVTRAGKKVQADVVVTGSFTAEGGYIKMTAKAIEISSGRTMINRSRTSRLTGNIFIAIDKLAKDMAKRMKEKLPPLKQRVIMKDTQVVYSGIIWRTAIIPGWGHYYAKSWRGYLYFSMWLASASTFGYYSIDVLNKKNDYEKAESSLQKKYDAYNKAGKNRDIAAIALIGVYAIAIADAIIFGGRYVTDDTINSRQFPSAPEGVQFAVSHTPSYNSKELGMQYQIFYRYRF